MGITISIKNRKTYYLLNKGERTKGFSISIIIYFISIFTLLFLHKDLWVEVTNNITIDNYSSAMSTCTASFVYSLLYSIILMCVGTPSFYIYKEKVRKILSQFDNNTSES
jgi:ABC-type sulfate transport system permease component